MLYYIILYHIYIILYITLYYNITLYNSWQPIVHRKKHEPSLRPHHVYCSQFSHNIIVQTLLKEN